MTVISAAIVSKNGKTLLARQFVDIARGRIEGLLAAFPKLIGSGGTQHTFIETDAIRYVYQPMEAFFMVLVTTRFSNIVEDLETLHLLAKIVTEQCRVLDEEQIIANSFDLIFAFDELIQPTGYKEKVTMQQIKTFIEMDSHEEKIHEMVERNKEREAKEVAKRKRHQIEMQRREREKMGGRTGATGFGSGSFSSDQPYVVRTEPRPQESAYQVEQRKAAERAAVEKAAPMKKGMQLGKAQKSADIFKALEKEEDIKIETAAGASSSAGAAATADSGPHEPVHIEIEETVDAELENDGGLRNLEVKGELKLTISKSEFSRIIVQLAADDRRGFQFKTHPNINKQAFLQEGQLALRDTSKAFPVGNSLIVAKWRLQSTDESVAPITVNCWPSPGGDGTTVVTMEYEVQNNWELADVTISVPIPGGKAPVIGDSEGNYEFDFKSSHLKWSLPLIDNTNATGRMEFTVPAKVDSSALFPIQVSFVSQSTFCPMHVQEVRLVDGEVTAQFSSVVRATAGTYVIA